MSESDRITSCLKSRIEQRFAVDMRFIERSTRLHDLGIDSLHMVDILLDIETELGFNFERMNIPSSPTFGELCDAIAENLQTQISDPADAPAKTPAG